MVMMAEKPQPSDSVRPRNPSRCPPFTEVQWPPPRPQDWQLEALDAKWDSVPSLGDNSESRVLA